MGGYRQLHLYRWLGENILRVAPFGKFLHPVHRPSSHATFKTFSSKHHYPGKWNSLYMTHLTSNKHPWLLNNILLHFWNVPSQKHWMEVWKGARISFYTYSVSWSCWLSCGVPICGIILGRKNPGFEGLPVVLCAWGFLYQPWDPL